MIFFFFVGAVGQKRETVYKQRDNYESYPCQVNMRSHIKISVNVIFHTLKVRCLSVQSNTLLF